MSVPVRTVLLEVWLKSGAKVSDLVPVRDGVTIDFVRDEIALALRSPDHLVTAGAMVLVREAIEAVLVSSPYSGS